jgi:hypothetical protein
MISIALETLRLHFEELSSSSSSSSSLGVIFTTTNPVDISLSSSLQQLATLSSSSSPVSLCEEEIRSLSLLVEAASLQLYCNPLHLPGPLLTFWNGEISRSSNETDGLLFLLIYFMDKITTQLQALKPTKISFSSSGLFTGDGFSADVKAVSFVFAGFEVCALFLDYTSNTYADSNNSNNTTNSNSNNNNNNNNNNNLPIQNVTMMIMSPCFVSTPITRD